MKKLLSILMVLLLAALPAMAEQTGIQAERQVITLEFTSPLLEGFSLKYEEDMQNGEYAHALIKTFLNGEELSSVGVMVDEAAKELFVSYPQAFENVLVFDEEDLTRVINAVGNALVETLNELKNDPEFIATMAELMEALAEAVNEAMAEAEAEAAQQAALETLLASLKYDDLAKEMEAIFTPVKTVYTAEDGASLTDYSYTLDQSVADRLVAAVGAFFDENAAALGGLAPDAATMAEFKSIVDELMAGFSATGSVGMDDKGNVAYMNVKMNANEGGDDISIGLTAADVKEEDKENVLLAFDVTLNGESAGINILIEDAKDGAAIRVKAVVGEEAVELGRIEVKAENDKDVVIRFVLGSGEEEMELVRFTAHVETVEPNIAFVEGGETVAPLKMSEEELGQFLQNAMTRLEASTAEMSAKIEAIMEPILNALVPAA